MEVSTSRRVLPADKVILQEHGMRRWGIRKKVLVVTLVPTLLTTLLLGLFFTYSWVNNIENLLKDRGESLSRQLAAGSEYGLFTANRSLLSSLSNALLE